MLGLPRTPFMGTFRPLCLRPAPERATLQVDEEATPMDLGVTSEGFATAVRHGKRLPNGLLGVQYISAGGAN